MFIRKGGGVIVSRCPARTCSLGGKIRITCVFANDKAHVWEITGCCIDCTEDSIASYTSFEDWGKLSVSPARLPQREPYVRGTAASGLYTMRVASHESLQQIRNTAVGRLATGDSHESDVVRGVASETLVFQMGLP